jgi:predicted ATP-binding protein involved in virulence
LINPDVLGKLLATGDLSNFLNAPPTLEPAIREAIAQRLIDILPGLGAFSPADPFGIELNGVRVPMRDLSDGYGSLLALAGHLIYHALRMTDWKTDPAEISGLVLIDEIDLHLHPAWQRHVIRDLGRTFPRMQFIATSHSPMVAGGLADESVLVLKDGENGIAVSAETASVKGWRADQILTSDLFGLPTSRNIEAEALMTKYALLLNERGPNDPEVRSLQRQVAPIAGFHGEGTVDEETYRLLQELLKERFQRVKPEIRTMMLAKATLMLSSGVDQP